MHSNNGCMQKCVGLELHLNARQIYICIFCIPTYIKHVKIIIITIITTVIHRIQKKRCESIFACLSVQEF